MRVDLEKYHKIKKEHGEMKCLLRKYFKLEWDFCDQSCSCNDCEAMGNRLCREINELFNRMNGDK